MDKNSSSYQCGLNGGYVDEQKLVHRCRARKCFFLKEQKQSTLASFSPELNMTIANTQLVKILVPVKSEKSLSLG